MKQHRFQRVKEILLGVIDLPVNDRAAFLDGVCENDPDLRREVEALLAHEEGSTAAHGFANRQPEPVQGSEEAAGTQAANLIGRAVGHYRIEAVLGEGGIGLVYRAEDTILSRPVALKFLRPEAVGSGQSRARFIREARAAAALDHPNVCTVHAIEEHEGELFIAMSFIEGMTLEERIRSGPLPLPEVLDLAVQVCLGLESAHEKGLVHRDIKPTNIMISRDGRVHILDFGLARPQGETEITRSGVILGTVAYMSPEQALAGPIDARTDIWSRGVVLFEMLTGTRPFRGDQITSLLYAIVHETPAEVRDLRPDLPAGLSPIVARALAKQQEDRYGSAAELRRDLELLRTHPGIPIPTGLRAPRRRPAVGRSARLIGTVLVLAAAAATVGGSLWTRYRAEHARIPQVRSRQITSGTAWEGEPAISPDGGRIAYVSGETGTATIAVIDSHGGRPIFLTAQDSSSNYSPSWFPDGSELVMVSDRSGSYGIWQIGQYGGGATMLIPHAYDPAVSPDGKRIAFTRLADSGFTRVFVATIAAPADSVALTHDDDGLWSHRHPAWSPDGQMICYESAEGVWLVPSRGGPARRLSSGGEVDVEPAWSPSGRFIYFSSTREGIRAIWRMTSRGTLLARLTLGTGPEIHPSISRDGSRLAYSTERTRYTLYVRDRKTGAETHLSDLSSAIMPAMAPDGGRIVFTSQHVGETGDLWLQTLAQGRPAGPPELLNRQRGDCSHATFSPDGKWIAYYCIMEGGRDIWIIPVRGGEPIRITEDPASDIQPAWSPDGRFLAFSSDRTGTHQLWIVPVRDGRAVGPERHLATGEVVAFAPAWSPDGREIAFVGSLGDDEERDCWVVPSDGAGPPRRISSGLAIQRLHWEPDGRRILASVGGADILLYSFSLDGTTAPEPVRPTVDFGLQLTSGFFDLSSDGHWLVYANDEIGGDIWVLETRPGAL